MLSETLQVYTLVGALTIPVVLIVLAGQVGKRAAATTAPAVTTTPGADPA